MLHPDDRLTFTEALRPPAGHRLDCAVGATYSLDLETLLAAPAAFALREVDTGDLDQLDPMALLASVRLHADRMMVFHQAGQLSVPRRHRLFALLERSVFAVTAPLRGIFHPKLWVLRFEDRDDGTLRHRVVVASRNITGDRSWDVVLRLDSVGDTRPSRAGTGLGGLAELVRALPGMSVGPVEASVTSRIESLATEIEASRFAPPPGVDAVRIHPLGLAEPPAGGPPFPAAVERLLVVSPFLSGPLVSRLPTSRATPVLVSRAESLDAVADAVERFDTRVLDASVVDDVSAAVEGGEVEGGEDAPPEVTLAGLHAKVYAYDTGDRSHVFVGSANATTAAFSTNVEVLAELIGPTSAIGVDRILGGSGNGSLEQLLVPYRPERLSDEAGGAPSRLQLLRRAIGALEIEARVQGAGTAFDVRYSQTCPESKVDLPPGVTAVCRPLTLGENETLPLLGPDGRVDALFAGVPLESLTAFLVIELSGEGDDCTFVVRAELLDGPVEREHVLIRSWVGDPERLMRYLRILLAAESGSSGELEVTGPGGSDGGTRKPRPVLSSAVPLLEQMLRVLRSDPARLRQVADLVGGFDAGVLPPDFLEMWEPIRTVAQERWR